MSDADRGDAAVAAALARIDRSERRFKALIVLAALVEAICIGAFLWLMDFRERLHWLVLLAAILVYATLAVGLFALGAHVNAAVLRVLRAIESR
jgi:hypothetical protein